MTKPFSGVMNRFKVTVSRWNGESSVQEVVFFDANAFEVVDTQSGAVALFASASGRIIGAAHGFDFIEKVQPDDGPIRPPGVPSTMAA